MSTSTSSTVSITSLTRAVLEAIGPNVVSEKMIVSVLMCADIDSFECAFSSLLLKIYARGVSCTSPQEWTLATVLRHAYAAPNINRSFVLMCTVSVVRALCVMSSENNVNTLWDALICLRAPPYGETFNGYFHFFMNLRDVVQPCVAGIHGADTWLVDALHHCNKQGVPSGAIGCAINAVRHADPMRNRESYLAAAAADVVNELHFPRRVVVVPERCSPPPLTQASSSPVVCYAPTQPASRIVPESQDSEVPSPKRARTQEVDSVIVVDGDTEITIIPDSQEGWPESQCGQSPDM